MYDGLRNHLAKRVAVSKKYDRPVISFRRILSRSVCPHEKRLKIETVKLIIGGTIDVRIRRIRVFTRSPAVIILLFCSPADALILQLSFYLRCRGTKMYGPLKKKIV